jgi:cytochrome c-type biogenesis protein CcmH
MLLWILFATMTAAAVLVLLAPLARRDGAGKSSPGGNDRRVYEDQLREIERDRAEGRIGADEAESARIEISRRLLAAADAEQAKGAKAAAQPVWHRRMASIAAVIVVPAVALGFYLFLGEPSVPSQSAFARASAPGAPQSIESLVSQVEAHLTRDPNDGPGWEVIAPVYFRLGRFDDAVVAWRHSIALNGDSASREANLGEALVGATNGVVTEDAKAAFARAVAIDPHEVKASYFLGLADEQDGNRDAAAAKWRAMLAAGPADAPWVSFVRAALARVTGAPIGQAGPSPADIAATDNAGDTQRAEMIRGMVQRLADRLHADGSDAEGWMRLVRAYVVLGDRDKAQTAISDAERAMAARPDDLKRIDDLARDLGLKG